MNVVNYETYECHEKMSLEQNIFLCKIAFCGKIQHKKLKNPKNPRKA